MRRSAVLLVLFALLAAPALAAEVELPLRDGKVLSGTVESADKKEVVVRTGPEKIRRISWSRLEPVGAYRVREALAPATDGKARLRLAEIAIELGLYKEARVELEKALALGAIDKKSFFQLLWRAEQDAVVAGVAQARKHAESGDFERAFETARQLKLHFAGAPNARAIDKLIRDLLKQVDKLEKQAAKEQAELERIKVEARRKKEILRRTTEASGWVDKGRSEVKKAEEARVIGNVTRARKYAEAADQAYRKARRALGRLRRVLGRDDPQYADVLGRLNDLDGEQFDNLYQTAWFFWEGRIYSKAEAFATRASWIDPVHPDLLDLREYLRESRIRLRFSDITNARPIVR